VINIDVEIPSVELLESGVRRIHSWFSDSSADELRLINHELYCCFVTGAGADVAAVLAPFERKGVPAVQERWAKLVLVVHIEVGWRV
jgi:hypothetical protein